MSVRLLSIRVRSDLIVTTSVLVSGGSFTVRSGSEGTFVKNRDGFSGVKTRKIISTTNKTSINGVTLILGFACNAVDCEATSGRSASCWIMAVVLRDVRQPRRSESSGE